MSRNRHGNSSQSLPTYTSGYDLSAYAPSQGNPPSPSSASHHSAPAFFNSSHVQTSPPSSSSGSQVGQMYAVPAIAAYVLPKSHLQSKEDLSKLHDSLGVIIESHLSAELPKYHYKNIPTISRLLLNIQERLQPIVEAGIGAATAQQELLRAYGQHKSDLPFNAARTANEDFQEALRMHATNYLSAVQLYQQFLQRDPNIARALPPQHPFRLNPGSNPDPTGPGRQLATTIGSYFEDGIASTVRNGIVDVSIKYQVAIPLICGLVAATSAGLQAPGRPDPGEAYNHIGLIASVFGIVAALLKAAHDCALGSFAREASARNRAIQLARGRRMSIGLMNLYKHLVTLLEGWKAISGALNGIQLHQGLDHYTASVLKLLSDQLAADMTEATKLITVIDENFVSQN